jgi:hypothetical protein
MVGMEGSAVLAVSKVARAEGAGAGAGRARVVCVDGGSAGCGRDLRHPANVLRAFQKTKETRV